MTEQEIELKIKVMAAKLYEDFQTTNEIDEDMMNEIIRLKDQLLTFTSVS